jgi:ribosome biogenesis protein MAK21
MPLTMAKGSQKSGSKDLTSAFKTINDSRDPKQSEILNTQAFSDLSQKIQARFSKLSHQDAKTKSTQPRKHETANGQRTVSKPTPESIASKVQKRGKKRDSQGIVKEQSKPKVSKETAEAVSTTKKVLENEVYALGGTTEDLALVANLDSESELDEVGGQDKAFGKTKFEQGLKKGIADILKQIDECGRPAPVESDAEGEENAETGDEEEEVADESSDAAPFASKTVSSKARSGSSSLLIAPRSDWSKIQLPSIKSSDTVKSKVLPGYIQQLHEHARSLLDTESENFKTNQQSSSSQKFYSTVIVSGTLSDKISALTLAVQESPLHNVRALETLINLAKKRSRAQAVDVLRALKDLFAQGSLLPSDRKLHTFSTNPSLLDATADCKSWKLGDALPGSLQPQHLIVWAYESWLKEKYFEMLKTLEIWCNDEIEFSKSKAVNFVYELLKEKPEQESNLLRLLTNKLGDPSKKVASQTSYLLMQLMAAHPLMKTTIISSIESELLFRPGQSLHAKYYAAITLNQTALSSKEEEVASKLLSIYFSLFVGLLKPADGGKGNSDGHSRSKFSRKSQRKSFEKHVDGSENAQAEDLQEKLTSAILTGINRAYPYTEANSQRYEHNLPQLKSLLIYRLGYLLT